MGKDGLGSWKFLILHFFHEAQEQGQIWNGHLPRSEADPIRAQVEGFNSQTEQTDQADHISRPRVHTLDGFVHRAQDACADWLRFCVGECLPRLDLLPMAA